uniref:Uncharacterized protein n=1 Tax=Timema monikensis TaxID=170555 RepID=A0A7R9HJ49_9NEOP|nr:unnamed protein product [Timema monikensis]
MLGWLHNLGHHSRNRDSTANDREVGVQIRLAELRDPPKWSSTLPRRKCGRRLTTRAAPLALFKSLGESPLQWQDGLEVFYRAISSDERENPAYVPNEEWGRLNIEELNPHLRDPGLPSSPDRDSNLDLPVLGSLAQHDTCALANCATTAGDSQEK